MRSYRTAGFWAWVGLAGCAGSIGLEQHRAAQSSQQAEYEQRLRAAEAERAGQVDVCRRALEDAQKERETLERRNDRLEGALIDKPRLNEGEAPRGTMGRGPADGLPRLRAGIDAALARAAPGALRGAEAKGRSLHLTFSLDRLFPLGGVELSSEGAQIARSLAEAVLAVGTFTAKVEAHADGLRPVPGAVVADSWELTLRQSMAVGRAFLAQGLDPSGLQLIARGHGAPVAPNDTEVGRAQNRRLVITLVPREPTSKRAP